MAPSVDREPMHSSIGACHKIGSCGQPISADTTSKPFAAPLPSCRFDWLGLAWTKARAAWSACAAKANDTTRAVIRDIQASGIQTLTGIVRTLQARGIKTPAGRHEWRPVQVSRLLAA